MRNAIIVWLRSNIVSFTAVRTVYLFGSFAKGYQGFSDVDLLIVFKEKNVRRWIARVERAFQLRFHRSLHIQKFHITQLKLVSSFVPNVSRSERLRWG
jgi:predicted nucleotidyltransferase